MTLRISVVLSTYNGQLYLFEQLQSLVAQTRQPSELVVRDDGSSDSTPNILDAFAETAPFPVRRIVDDDGNVGFLRSFERVIAAAEGDVIALCDQDDIWYPTKLETIEERLRQRPDAAYFFSDADLIAGDGELLGRTAWSTVGLTETMRRDIETGRAFNLLRTHPYVTGATMAFRSTTRSVFLPFPDLLFTAADPGWHVHDGWIALMLAASNPGVAETTPLIGYRQHPGQAMSLPPATEAAGTAQSHDDKAMYASEIRNLRPVIDQLRLASKTLGLAAQLERRRDHLSARLALVVLPRRLRLKPVVNEFRKGGYSQFSAGFRSAVKDLGRAL